MDLQPSSYVRDNLASVHKRICQAAKQYNRSLSSIQLLAVSKKKPASLVREAAKAGQRLFGENYLQEALLKMKELRDLKDLEFHFIGDVQSNKTKLIAENFAWVHSVHRKKIAHRLNEQRSCSLPPLNICLEVNVSEEVSKDGIVQFEALYDLARFIITSCPRLHLRGLMAIPKPTDTFVLQRQPYKRLKQILCQLQNRQIPVDTLSMGMSYDLEAAIAEGATFVRLGQAVFGPRA